MSKAQQFRDGYSHGENRESARLWAGVAKDLAAQIDTAVHYSRYEAAAELVHTLNQTIGKMAAHVGALQPPAAPAPQLRWLKPPRTPAQPRP